MTFSTIDPAFPQIPEILSPDYMKALLQKQWLKNEESTNLLTIKNCVIGEKRHKPGKKFQVSYHLELFNRQTQAHCQQVLTANIFIAGQNIPSIGIESEVVSKDGADFHGVLYLPELSTMLWAFPYDKQLVNLPLLHNTEYLMDYFNSRPGIATLLENERVDSVDFKVMHYLPEKSCMTRYNLAIVDLNTGHKRHLQIFGKNYADHCAIQVYGIMTQLVEQSEYCAQPLFVDEPMNTLWQSHVPGMPLEWREELADASVLISNIAACIARFHGSRLTLEQTYNEPEIFKQLQSSCNMVAAADQALANRVLSIVQRLSGTYCADWANEIETPLHLDLKMGNLLFEKNRVTLIDMDGVRLGNPLVDIGSFIANVYLNGLRARANQYSIDVFINEFIHNYSRMVKWHLDRFKLHWYVSAALIHEVLRRSFRQQEETRIELARKIVDISESYLQRVISHKPI